MKYHFYRELREHMGHVLRKTSGISKKKMKKCGADPVSTAIKMFFDMPGAGLTIDSAILAEEEDYAKQGKRVYIPQSKELVEMLWRSNMDVTLSDLDDFPRCFSVAWPKGTVIDGVELDGCLVWFGRHNSRNELAGYLRKYTDKSIGMIEDDIIKDEEHYSFHLSYGVGHGVDKWYMRMSMPQKWIMDCLKSQDDLEARLGVYDSPLVAKMSKEEVHQQYVAVRSVLNLMVYATACPDALLSGWPEDMNSTSEMKGRNPLTLKSPIPKGLESQGGTHASPVPHFRNPHFRQYPLRNGKRRKGIVFVSGCLVNAEIDPKTVVKK